MQTVHQMLTVDRQARATYAQAILNIDRKEDNFSSKMVIVVTARGYSRLE